MLFTLPSVTVRNVSISDSFFSASGASLIKDMATCTILVVACLSWPCFFESNKTCSLSKLQSPEFFDIVMMATNSREVEARSDAFEETRLVEDVCRNDLCQSDLSSVLFQSRKLL